MTDGCVQSNGFATHESNRVALSSVLLQRRRISIMRWILRSKIHKALVTQAELSYVGSITIDSDLLELTGLIPGEKVLVVSNTSGARLETYVIEGEKGSGVICMNGAAAHLISKGEEIIIMGFELTDEPVTPKMILVDEENRFVRWLDPEPLAREIHP